MLTKTELGRRLRLARFEKGLTLKEVAARCGMSATHISEVERGKTSPTIGALERIAGALEENPAHFVREENMPRVVLTRAGEECTTYNVGADGRPGQFEVLSRGLAGGIMQVLGRSMPAGTKVVAKPRIGELVVLAMQGMVRFTVGGESYVLREGDTLQFRMDDGFAAEVLGDEEHVGIAIYASPTLYPT